jgi:hypothetical protein
VTLALQQTGPGASLDLLRAYLSALSNRGDDASPVSVIALQHALRRRAVSAAASELLNTLCMVKDAQDLGRGFYLPAPSHLVLLEGFALVISGLPTQELERTHGCKATVAGSSRVLNDPQTQSLGLPTSLFSDWLEAPKSTTEWTRERLRTARFVEPHGLEGCETFQSSAVRSSSRWQPFNEQVLPQTGKVLLRHRGRTGQTNHYLLRVSDGRVAGMSELPHNPDDARRMQFGLRALENDPARFRLATNDHATVISLPRPPKAEERLLTALGAVSIEPTTGWWSVRIPNYSVPVATTTLAALGLKLQEART